MSEIKILVCLNLNKTQLHFLILLRLAFRLYSSKFTRNVDKVTNTCKLAYRPTRIVAVELVQACEIRVPGLELGLVLG